MTNKVTGLHLSPECVKRLKMFSICSGKTMSQIVEDLVIKHIGYYDGNGVFDYFGNLEDLQK